MEFDLRELVNHLRTESSLKDLVGEMNVNTFKWRMELNTKDMD